MANTQEIQQYVRIALYYLWGALGSYGIAAPADNTKAIIASAIGGLATLAWTAYGTRLNGLLEFARQKSGVEEVQIKVDPLVITPTDVTNNTSPGISAKAA